MEKIKLLLVEDEPFLARVIKDSLEQKGYAVTHTEDGEKAYSQFMNTIFALCIVDVMLPRTDGFILVQQIRTSNSQVPVLFLTARTATEDLVEGYRSGGNDYLKKPFSLEELYLRINELLNRNQYANNQQEDLLPIGRFLFTPNKQTLHYPGTEVIKLSHKEAALLVLLYRQRNNLLDRKQALTALWGDDNFFNTRTMDVFITKLRKHLKPDPAIEILNIRGRGYKLIC